MQYDDFIAEFEKLTGIRLDLYKEKQMKRRINTLIERKKISGYEDYISLLQANEIELSAFIDYITINVTEFFRTSEHWDRFENEVLKKLVENSDERLKIWCCACSTGEEAYSLAMSLLNLTDASKFHIIASDVDENVIRKAAEGVYDESCMKSVPSELRRRYFDEAGSKWKIADDVKACVSFRKIDLLKDEYPSACDLVVCRNVLIYFTDEGKDLVFTNFKKCMKPSGYLFTGKTEQIVYYKRRGFRKISTFLYENTDK